MRPVHQNLLVMCILGLLLVINAGCGKKHLHVSTMSGSPGEGELATELDESENIGPLSESGLDESGLENQETETAAASADDLEPLDFTQNAAPPSQESDSQSNDDLFAGLDDGTKSMENQGEEFEAPGQEIQSQSQSPSLPPLTPMGDGTDNSNLDDSDSDSLPPLTAFTTPDDSNLSDFGSGNEETRLPIEQLPENIAVAKAEPSDTFRDQLDKMKAEDKATRDAGLNDVFFEFDSWTLTSEGRQALDQGAEWLNETASAKLLIEGHCDSRGTQAYNLVLGKKRAGAIRDYLLGLGITQERVAIISYGQDKPFCSDHTEVCYQLNRRGHLLVLNQ